MSPVEIVVALVALERLTELAIARRNTRRLLAAGAVEHGARHYPFVVVLHVAWLATLLVWVPEDAPIRWPILALFVLLQFARAWVIASLGPYWTTRIIVPPGAPTVRRGPYRWMRHPNYAIVAAEIALLPLAFDAWDVALLFSLANALLLSYRIRSEEAARGE
ncbi:MAG: isoprenylcysteine carboxyl methyltransferase family protein [Alphaproteobacteria bacterium]